MTPAPLTDADLAELERLAEKATARPWVVNGTRRIESEHEHGVVNDGWIIGETNGPDDRRNSTFIAAACNLAPALVAEVRRLRERLAACNCGCGEVCNGH